MAEQAVSASFGNYCRLGVPGRILEMEANNPRMNLQQLTRLCTDIGVLGGKVPLLQLSDVKDVFEKSKTPGARRIDQQQFLSVLTLLGEECSTNLTPLVAAAPSPSLSASQSSLDPAAAAAAAAARSGSPFAAGTDLPTPPDLARPRSLDTPPHGVLSQAAMPRIASVSQGGGGGSANNSFASPPPGRSKRTLASFNRSFNRGAGDVAPGSGPSSPRPPAAGSSMSAFNSRRAQSVGRGVTLDSFCQSYKEKQAGGGSGGGGRAGGQSQGPLFPVGPAASRDDLRPSLPDIIMTPDDKRPPWLIQLLDRVSQLELRVDAGLREPAKPPPSLYGFSAASDAAAAGGTTDGQHADFDKLKEEFERRFQEHDRRMLALETSTAHTRSAAAGGTAAVAGAMAVAGGMLLSRPEDGGSGGGASSSDAEAMARSIAELQEQLRAADAAALSNMQALEARLAACEAQCRTAEDAQVALEARLEDMSLQPPQQQQQQQQAADSDGARPASAAAAAAAAAGLDGPASSASVGEQPRQLGERSVSLSPLQARIESLAQGQRAHEERLAALAPLEARVEQLAQELQRQQQQQQHRDYNDAAAAGTVAVSSALDGLSSDQQQQQQHEERLSTPPRASTSAAGSTREQLQQQSSVRSNTTTNANSVLSSLEARFDVLAREQQQCSASVAALMPLQARVDELFQQQQQQGRGLAASASAVGGGVSMREQRSSSSQLAARPVDPDASLEDRFARLEQEQQQYNEQYTEQLEYLMPLGARVDALEQQQQPHQAPSLALAPAASASAAGSMRERQQTPQQQQQQQQQQQLQQQSSSNWEARFERLEQGQQQHAEQLSVLLPRLDALAQKQQQPQQPQPPQQQRSQLDSRQGSMDLPTAPASPRPASSMRGRVVSASGGGGGGSLRERTASERAASPASLEARVERLAQEQRQYSERLDSLTMLTQQQQQIDASAVIRNTSVTSASHLVDRQNSRGEGSSSAAVLLARVDTMALEQQQHGAQLAALLPRLDFLEQQQQRQRDISTGGTPSSKMNGRDSPRPGGGTPAQDARRDDQLSAQRPASSAASADSRIERLVQEQQAYSGRLAALAPLEAQVEALSKEQQQHSERLLALAALTGGAGGAAATVLSSSSSSEESHVLTRFEALSAELRTEVQQLREQLASVQQVASDGSSEVQARVAACEVASRDGDAARARAEAALASADARLEALAQEQQVLEERLGRLDPAVAAAGGRGSKAATPLSGARSKAGTPSPGKPRPAANGAASDSERLAVLEVDLQRQQRLISEQQQVIDSRLAVINEEQLSTRFTSLTTQLTTEIQQSDRRHDEALALLRKQVLQLADRRAASAASAAAAGAAAAGGAGATAGAFVGSAALDARFDELEERIAACELSAEWQQQTTDERLAEQRAAEAAESADQVKLATRLAALEKEHREELVALKKQLAEAGGGAAAVGGDFAPRLQELEERLTACELSAEEQQQQVDERFAELPLADIVDRKELSAKLATLANKMSLETQRVEKQHVTMADVDAKLKRVTAEYNSKLQAMQTSITEVQSSVQTLDKRVATTTAAAATAQKAAPKGAAAATAAAAASGDSASSPEGAEWAAEVQLLATEIQTTQGDLQRVRSELDAAVKRFDTLSQGKAAGAAAGAAAAAASVGALNAAAVEELVEPKLRLLAGDFDTHLQEQLATLSADFEARMLQIVGETNTEEQLEQLTRKLNALDQRLTFTQAAQQHMKDDMEKNPHRPGQSALDSDSVRPSITAAGNRPSPDVERRLTALSSQIIEVNAALVELRSKVEIAKELAMAAPLTRKPQTPPLAAPKKPAAAPAAGAAAAAEDGKEAEASLAQESSAHAEALVKMVDEHTNALDARLVSLTKAVYAIIPEFGVLKLTTEQNKTSIEECEQRLDTMSSRLNAASEGGQMLNRQRTFNSLAGADSSREAAEIRALGSRMVQVESDLDKVMESVDVLRNASKKAPPPPTQGVVTMQDLQEFSAKMAELLGHELIDMGEKLALLETRVAASAANGGGGGGMGGGMSVLRAEIDQTRSELSDLIITVDRRVATLERGGGGGGGGGDVDKMQARVQTLERVTTQFGQRLEAMDQRIDALIKGGAGGGSDRFVSGKPPPRL